MARFTPVPGLDEMVALMVAPEVRDVADDVRKIARKLAPNAKSWVHMADGRVRDTHVEAPGRAMNINVPTNLRFDIRSMKWDMVDDESRHVGASTWMMRPRDFASGGIANSKQCRCHATIDRDAIRNTLRTGPTELLGARIRIVVSATGNRIVASEFGETYDHVAKPAKGLHWMGRAAATAAAMNR